MSMMGLRNRFKSMFAKGPVVRLSRDTGAQMYAKPRDGVIGRLFHRRWVTGHLPHQGEREKLRRRCGGFHFMRRMAQQGFVWDDQLGKYIPKEA
jgi:hypothetical protein